MGWIRERKLKDGTTRFYPIIEEIGAPGWHGGAFNKRRDAERALAKAEADKAKGISLPTATNKRTTFDELVKRWLGSLDQTRRNFKNQRAHMIFWCNH